MSEYFLMLTTQHRSFELFLSQDVLPFGHLVLYQLESWQVDEVKFI